MKIREAALSLLNEWEAEGKYINLALSSHILDSFKREDKAALTALLYTTVENKIKYDYYIGALAKRSTEKLSKKVLNILRLGLCQIDDMDKIPDFAAVNESVSLGSNKGERAIINAVLRAAVRAKAEGGLPLPPYEKNPARYYSVKYSFPLWIVKKLIAQFGEDEAKLLFLAFSENPPLDISVNTLKIKTDELLSELLKRGALARKSEIAEDSICILSKGDPTQLYGFSEGYFFIQDEASALAVRALSPKRGDFIIDVCSAPGGKSFLSAVLMENEGKVLPFDIHESKISLITSGAARLGLDCICADACDAKEPREELFGKADKLIVDAPCSGLGVISKKSDLKYKDEKSVETLPCLQLEILEASVKYLKRGGELLYSTCTLIEEENSGVVSEFLKRNPEFSPVDFELGEIKSKNGAVTLYPHVHGTDGFFIARMRKSL